MGFSDRLHELTEQSSERRKQRLEQMIAKKNAAKDHVAGTLHSMEDSLSEKAADRKIAQAQRRQAQTERLEAMRAKMNKPSARMKLIRRITSYVVAAIALTLLFTETWPVSLFREWGWELETGYDRFDDLPIFLATTLFVYIVTIPVSLFVRKRFDKPDEPQPENTPRETAAQQPVEKPDFLD